MMTMVAAATIMSFPPVNHDVTKADFSYESLPIVNS